MRLIVVVPYNVNILRKLPLIFFKFPNAPFSIEYTFVCSKVTLSRFSRPSKVFVVIEPWKPSRKNVIPFKFGK